MSRVPPEVEAICDVLLAHGFVKSREEESESFGNVTREYEDGDLVALVSCDRGQWSVDLRSRLAGADTYDVPAVRALITGDASRDTLSLSEIEGFLQSHMADIRTKFDPTELAATIGSLQALMSSRAKRRLGI